MRDFHNLKPPNWRNELHGAPPGGLVSLHMTALVARVQGLGTRARRCRLWRHVVRRDSAVQEGLHEHTPARITSRRGSRHHGIDGGSLALGTTTTSMACIAACIACLCTAMATSYNLCTYSIISTPSKHFLPPFATSHQLRVLLHPVAAVNLVRESDRCSSPFPLLTSAIHWRLVTGDCTSSATNRPAFHPHQVAHLHPSNGTGRQSSGIWVIPVQSAFRQMRQQHDNTA